MATKKRIYNEPQETNEPILIKKHKLTLEKMLENLSLKRKSHISTKKIHKKQKHSDSKKKQKGKKRVPEDDEENTNKSELKQANDNSLCGDKNKDIIENIASFFYRSDAKKNNIKRLLEQRSQVVEKSFQVIYKYVVESRMLFFEHLKTVAWDNKEHDFDLGKLQEEKDVCSVHLDSLTQTKIYLDEFIRTLYEMRHAVVEDIQFTSELPCFIE